MTRPSFTAQISLGNVLTVLAMAAAVIGAFTVLQSTSGLHAKQIADIEGRLRLVERSAARQDEKMEAVARDIADIKIEQRATNGLLRQLITQTGGTK